jgi:HSP20 family molecular chaperone IbpA
MTIQQYQTVANTENRTNPGIRQPTHSALRPDVDVHENDHFIKLYAELPGVNQDDLNITIDKNNLLLEATATIDAPTEMDVVYAEFQVASFKRSFSLSNELDADNVKALLTNGILQLTIPKKEIATPRKIEVNVA